MRSQKNIYFVGEEKERESEEEEGSRRQKRKAEGAGKDEKNERWYTEKQKMEGKRRES